MMRALVLIALVAACGSKKQDKPDNSAACSEAAKAATTALVGPLVNAPSLSADAKAAMQDKGSKLADVIVKHCTTDHWSDDVVTCYKNAASMNDMRTCRGKLPADQAQALLTEEMGAMSAGAPGQMAPPPGH